MKYSNLLFAMTQTLQSSYFKRKRSMIGIFMLFLLALTISQANAATNWQVVSDESMLSFIAVQDGANIEGHFEKFETTIIFDKNNLQHSKFDALIDLNSVNTKISDRDEILRSKDFFSIKLWPNARFKTIEINHIEKNNYRAKASLKIRNISLPVIFDFSVNIIEENEMLFGEGTATLDRFKYDMAHGDFTDTKTVGAKIRVNVKIKAIPKI